MNVGKAATIWRRTSLSEPSEPERVLRRCQSGKLWVAACVLLTVATSAWAAGSVKMLVDAADGAVIEELRSRGAEVIADRGSYLVLSVSAEVARRAAKGRVRTDLDTITLRRAPIDTRYGAYSAAPQVYGPLGASPLPRRLKLVQLEAPPTDEDLKVITATGARIVQYVPQNAYIVWTADESVAQALRSSLRGGPIQYYADYHADYALSPRLDRALASPDPVVVTAQFFNDGVVSPNDLASAKQLAIAVVADPQEVLGGTYTNLRLQIRGSDLDDLVRLESVVNVEPYVTPRLFGERQGQTLAANLDLLQTAPSGPGYLAWLSAHGFSTNAADYPIVAVVDDGVDNGTTTPALSEFYELNNPANPSRMIFSVLPPGSSASGAEGPDGHGNINASIVGGYNADLGAAAEDNFGFNYGLGISPHGRLANVRIFAPDFDVGFGDSTMVDDYYARGARLSTNSWGADVLGAYDSDAQLYDFLTRDAQASSGGNQQLLFVFAAGNAGPGAGTVGTPGTAKNVLTVAAAESSNPDASLGDGCGSSGAGGDDVRDLAGFSSRGPCADGRVKPDITAPGTFVQGAASQPIFNGSGVCGAAGNDFASPGTDALFPPGSIYTWSSGTSHSTPGVAGACSLIQEFLARVYGVTSPSPALQKAYALHSARHMTGSGANEDLPGNNQGLGMIDLGLGFDTTAPRYLLDQTTVFATSGETLAITGQVPDPTKPVRVALVWTDAPGATVGDAFVNDLNLTFQVGGSTYLGNNLILGESQTGGSADFRNNAESVFLSPGPSGLATITVDALTIAGDGVPGNADTTDQDFAIVAYNFVLASAAGIVSLDRGAYNCADSLQLLVSDADLTATGTTTAVLTTTGGDAETVTLTETPANSGVFVASVSTVAGTVVVGDGALEVADGESITATYDDADDGTGSPATVQDAASVDCTSTVISNVTAINISDVAATVTLDTDETATVLVRYGSSCVSLTNSQSGTAPNTLHAVDLSGLTPATQHFYRVEATDIAGNLTIDDNGGACYSLFTLLPTDCNDPANLFSNCGFESGDFSGWVAQDIASPFVALAVGGAGNSPGFGMFTSAPPEGAFSVQHGFDGAGPGTITVAQEVTLVASATSVSFDYRGGWDLGTFGASVDREFYVDIEPSGGGAALQSTLILTATAGTIVGDTGVLSGSVDVSAFAGQSVRIVFRWVIPESTSGPAFFELDNITASAFPPATAAGAVFFEQSTFMCSDTVQVRVTDTDLAGTATTAVAVVTGAGDSETVTLAEIPPNSAIFRGSIATVAAAAVTGDGTLQVTDGETITATYNDADDGTGNPATAQDTATVDCLAPLISNVTAIAINASSATATFDTDETTTALVRYGTSCGSLTGVQSGAGVLTVHSITLSALTPLTQYFYRVEATDPAGNLSIDDNGGACYSFTTADQADYFTEIFESSDYDLANQTVTLTPDGSADFYQVCVQTAAGFPTDPAGGTALFLFDDDSSQVTPSGGPVSLYGVSYTSFYVGSNGYITFGGADTDFSETLADHFSMARISAFFDDLDPSSGGAVSWRELGDRVAVTYSNVPGFGVATSNDFQVEMFFSGKISITHLGVAESDGLVGVSQGLGIPADFIESDLSTSSPVCPCGNGVTDVGEDCDDAGESATCDADCTFVVCGDGTLNSTASEQCDDGNGAAGDGCDGLCQTESGFTCTVPGLPCQDIDECVLGSDNCDANATCTNTPGSFTCACNAGFTGDGISCADIDECTLGTHNCDVNATCTNTPGSFTCACNSGFIGDGVTCNLPLDHFVAYKIRASKQGDGSERFPRDWNISLDDIILSNTSADDPENYTVRGERSLLNPAMKNDEPGPQDPALHYLRYQIKKAREGIGALLPQGKFPRAVKHVRRLWTVANQFGVATLESRKVTALLVPAAKDESVPPAAPGDSDHFICYRVKAVKNVGIGQAEGACAGNAPVNAGGPCSLEEECGGTTGVTALCIQRKNLQAYFSDQFDDCAVTQAGAVSFDGTVVAGKCLFDIKKVREICNPVIKSEVIAPRLTSAVITGSAPSGGRSLVCYQPRLSSVWKSAAAAALAGAAVGDKVPKQSTHSKRIKAGGNQVFTQPGNLFPVPLEVDTRKQEMVCVPSTASVN